MYGTSRGAVRRARRRIVRWRRSLRQQPKKRIQTTCDYPKPRKAYDYEVYDYDYDYEAYDYELRDVGGGGGGRASGRSPGLGRTGGRAGRLEDERTNGLVVFYFG
jgi:hypothetical protein